MLPSEVECALWSINVVHDVAGLAAVNDVAGDVTKETKAYVYVLCTKSDSHPFSCSLFGSNTTEILLLYLAHPLRRTIFIAINYACHPTPTSCVVMGSCSSMLLLPNQCVCSLLYCAHASCSAKCA